MSTSFEALSIVLDKLLIHPLSFLSSMKKSGVLLLAIASGIIFIRILLLSHFTILTTLWYWTLVCLYIHTNSPWWWHTSSFQHLCQYRATCLNCSTCSVHPGTVLLLVCRVVGKWLFLVSITHCITLLYKAQMSFSVISTKYIITWKNILIIL